MQMDEMTESTADTDSIYVSSCFLDALAGAPGALGRKRWRRWIEATQVLSWSTQFLLYTHARFIRN